MIHTTLSFEMGGCTAALTTYFLENSPEMDPARTRPLVLICPGGGYRSPSDREAEPVALRFNSLGFHAAVLRYSVAPARFPTQLYQLAGAMALLRGRAAEFFLDPDRFFVLGFSAGGHLAASLGAYWSSDWLTHGCGLGAAQCRPSGLILCYPLLICQGGAREQLCNAALLGSGAADPGQIARISLERHVGPDFPPCFLWQGALDEDIPLQNTLRFALALEAAGRPFALRIYQTAAHGLALATEETREADGSGVCAEARRWPQEAAEWMRLSRPWGAP